MAKCPKCGNSQDWWELLKLDANKLLICWQCNSTLSIDSQRSSILAGGFIAFMALPFSNLLPFDWNIFWGIAVTAIYMPLSLSYMKLNLVSESDLEITSPQEKEFQQYAKKRKRLNYLGQFLFWTGFIASIAISSVEFIQQYEIMYFVPFGIVIGLFISGFTKCPFCKKITAKKPFGDKDGIRCMNCHKEIDID